MCLYSTDPAFSQHKHDKYSLQTEGQKPADKEIFERQVKMKLEIRGYGTETHLTRQCGFPSSYVSYMLFAFT